MANHEDCREAIAEVQGSPSRHTPSRKAPSAPTGMYGLPAADEGGMCKTIYFPAYPHSPGKTIFFSELEEYRTPKLGHVHYNDPLIGDDINNMSPKLKRIRS